MEKKKKKMNRQRLLLLQHLGGTWGDITKEQITQLETCMTMFALAEIRKVQDKDISDQSISFFKMLFHANYENKLLWMRYQMYKIAVKQAKLRSKTEGYKMYVVRSSKVGYTIISSLQLKVGRKFKIMKKEVTREQLETTASLILYPDGTSTGRGFSGDDLKMAAKKENIVTNVHRKKKRTTRKRHNNQAVKNPKKDFVTSCKKVEKK
nr:hypothetical protein [uncultured Draconibacterium sp.]